MKELKNPIMYVVEEGDGNKAKDQIVKKIPLNDGKNERRYESLVDEAETFIKLETKNHPHKKFYAIYGSDLISQIEISVKLVM